MARIDAAYNYLLSTYGKATGSRYDSHKKSELRSLYNNIIKTNKESPLYKITQTGDVKEFAIDIKANAHRMQNVIASLNADGNDISSMLRKKWRFPLTSQPFPFIMSEMIMIRIKAALTWKSFPLPSHR